MKIKYEEETNGKMKKIKEVQNKNIELLENYLKEHETETKNIQANKKRKVIDFDPTIPAVNNISKINNLENPNINKSFGGKFNY